MLEKSGCRLGAIRHIYPWCRVSTIGLNQALWVCMCFCGFAYVFGAAGIHQLKFVGGGGGRNGPGHGRNSR